MGNCKDCRWWDDRQECQAADWVLERHIQIPNGMVAVYANAADDTNLDAALKTGPTFGCVLFEAKEVKS